MKCRLGDRVRFLNEVGGGVVLKIIDNKTVSVQTEDGFEIPTLDSELVIVGREDDQSQNILQEKETIGNNKKFKVQYIDTKTDNQSRNTIKIQNDNKLKVDEKFFIAFVAKNINSLNDCEIALYIINSSMYMANYSLSIKEKDMNILIKYNLLLPDSKEYINTYLSKEFTKEISFNLQAIFFSNEPFTMQQPVQYDFTIQRSDLLNENRYVVNQFFHENSYILSFSDLNQKNLLGKIPDDTIYESIKLKDGQKKQPIKQEIAEVEEVDLHIQEIVENYQNYSAGEIIQMQLSRFETALEGGIISDKTRKMVFIHGLGNGKLKHEVRKLLDTKYKKLRYQDASFKEYGYGATLVYVK